MPPVVVVFPPLTSKPLFASRLPTNVTCPDPSCVSVGFSDALQSVIFSLLMNYKTYVDAHEKGTELPEPIKFTKQSTAIIQESPPEEEAKPAVPLVFKQPSIYRCPRCHLSREGHSLKCTQCGTDFTFLSELI